MATCIVLAEASAHQLNITQLCIAFGAGNSFQLLGTHKIVCKLASDHCATFPMFNAFTGFDSGLLWSQKTHEMYMIKAHQCFLAARPTPDSLQNRMEALEYFTVSLLDHSDSL
ncbi:hypothetical protein Hamer_G004390 [Homarus americanus]|uniref:Uncharacterized protein n=1 Tax=Homarus americanus TaxID=6706 RepID=A0A8J5MT55_HOMAM|nr:hypothetical protein Hamer_G004390 [Homarus americanus]